MNKLIFLVLISSLSSTSALAGHFDGHVDVTVGPLSPRALTGQKVFNEKCGSCHGQNGGGTLEGPPLIHDIYNSGHHDDGSFSRAVTQGVQQHHWPYGNMPAQPDVGFSDMMGIVSFVRELQKQNGIIKKAHRM